MSNGAYGNNADWNKGYYAGYADGYRKSHKLERLKRKFTWVWSVLWHS